MAQSNDDDEKESGLNPLNSPLSSLSWYPKGIATQCESRKTAVAGFDYYRLSTRWGSFDVYLPKSNPADEKWWSEVTSDQYWWGEIPDLNGALITEVEWSEGDCWHISLANSDQPLVLRSLPIDRNGHGKKLAEIGLPDTLSALGGLQINGKDVLLLHKKPQGENVSQAIETALINDDLNRAKSLMQSAGESLGKFHKEAQKHHSTPNIERIWNERLKKLENLTKANTLWRAPHSHSTKGTITHRNMGLAILFLKESTMGRDNSPPVIEIGGCYDGVFNALIDLPPDQPAIRDIGAIFSSLNQLLHKVSQVGGDIPANEGNLQKVESDLRKALLTGWQKTAPSTFCGDEALDTHKGGVFIWEYEQKLEQLALCKMYEIPPPQYLRNWLRKVSRIQAAMFQNRTWSGLSLGSYVLAGGIVALWINGSLADYDALSAIPIAMMGYLMKRFYNSKALPAHQPL